MHGDSDFNQSGKVAEEKFVDDYEGDHKRAIEVKPYVDAFLNGGEEEKQRAIAYLRGNKGNVSEFVLQVGEAYNPTDKNTPILRLGEIIESLL